MAVGLPLSPLSVLVVSFSPLVSALNCAFYSSVAQGGERGGAENGRRRGGGEKRERIKGKRAGRKVPELHMRGSLRTRSTDCDERQRER